MISSDCPRRDTKTSVDWVLKSAGSGVVLEEYLGSREKIKNKAQEAIIINEILSCKAFLNFSTFVTSFRIKLIWIIVYFCLFYDDIVSWGQFHQCSMRSFYICKFCEQLFCAYVLGLYLTGARLLEQKLRVEHWWNWTLISPMGIVMFRISNHKTADNEVLFVLFFFEKYQIGNNKKLRILVILLAR